MKRYSINGTEMMFIRMVFENIADKSEEKAKEQIYDIVSYLFGYPSNGKQLTDELYELVKNQKFSEAQNLLSNEMKMRCVEHMNEIRENQAGVPIEDIKVPLKDVVGELMTFVTTMRRDTIDSVRWSNPPEINAAYVKRFFDDLDVSLLEHFGDYADDIIKYGISICPPF